MNSWVKNVTKEKKKNISFVFITQNVTVLLVAPSHVILTLDSVDANQGSLDHAVIAVR